MGQIALSPHVVHACIAAYAEATATMQSSHLRPLDDKMKSTIATTIIGLAERGIEDPAQLAKSALAQVGGCAAAE